MCFVRSNRTIIFALRLINKGLLQIMWTIFHGLVAEGRLRQRFAEFSGVGKLGMNRRWEDLGGSWTYTASPDFVCGRLGGEHPLTEGQPHMSFLRHQGIYCAAFPSIRRPRGCATWPRNW